MRTMGEGDYEDGRGGKRGRERGDEEEVEKLETAERDRKEKDRELNGKKNSFKNQKNRSTARATGR